MISRKLRELLLLSLLGAILCFLPFLVSGCGPRQIKIGVVIPLTGIRRYFGDAMKKGIDLAVEDMNRQGMVNGKLVCCYEDDESDPEKARLAALRLVKRNKVQVLIGSYSNLNTLAVAEVAEETQTPHISPTSAAEAISRSGYKWVFRLNSPSSHYALTILDFLNTVLHAERIAIVHENDDFGIRTSQYVQKYASEMKGKVVLCSGYDTETTDFVPLLKTVKLKKPDTLLMVSHLQDGIGVMKAAHRVDLNVKSFAGCGAGFCHTDLIEEGGENVEFLFTVTQWSDQVDWQGARLFAEHYEERYGAEPGYHGAENYAAIQVLSACFRNKNVTNRRRLREALVSVNTETVFGNIRFESYQDYSNQNSHSLLIQQIQGGHFVLVWPEEYRKGSILFPTPPWNKRKKL